MLIKLFKLLISVTSEKCQLFIGSHKMYIIMTLNGNYKTFHVSTTQPKNKLASIYTFLTKLNIETNMKSIEKKKH